MEPLSTVSREEASPIVTIDEPASAEIGTEVLRAQPGPPTRTRHLSVGQSVARGALALLSTQPLTWGATLLTAILVPRLLGAAVLGQLTIVVTISGLASTITVLGISEYLVRRFAQHPQTIRRDAGIALALQTVTACVGVLVIAAVGWLVPTPIVNYPLLLVGLLPVLAAPAQTVLLSSFRGREKHKSYAWLNASTVVLSSVSAVLVLLVGGSIVLATAVSGALAFAGTLVGWKLSGLRPVLPRLDRSLTRDFVELVRGGFPFLSWQLTLLAYGQINRLLLGIFVATTEVGWFAAAYQIIAVVVFVPTLVIAPLFPALSRSVHDPVALRRTIAQAVRLLLLVMVLLGAGSIVIAPLVPRVLGWPGDFEHAVPLMMILALHLPIVAVDMVLGVVLMAIHRESSLVLVGIVAAVFNVVGNLVFIPYFEQAAGNGAIGAAMVTVLTEILMCIGAIILIPKHLLDPASAWAAGRLALAGVASVLVGLALLPVLEAGAVVPSLAFLLVGCSAVVTYAGAAILLRAVTLDDVRPLLAHVMRPRQ